LAQAGLSSYLSSLLSSTDPLSQKTTRLITKKSPA
jgi:hypothetical protein